LIHNGTLRGDSGVCGHPTESSEERYCQNFWENLSHKALPVSPSGLNSSALLGVIDPVDQQRDTESGKSPSRSVPSRIYFLPANSVAKLFIYLTPREKYRVLCATLRLWSL